MKVENKTWLIGLIVVGMMLVMIKFFMPVVSHQYTEEIKTGGNIEAHYSQYGPHSVKTFETTSAIRLGKITIYYPEKLEQKYPVIIVSNGTLAPAFKYTTWFKRLASWGFIVAGNEDAGAWDGSSAHTTLNYLLEQNNVSSSIFYQKIDKMNVGAVGHSQGGISVLNSITNYETSTFYKTAVVLSPANESLSFHLGWSFDLEKVEIPLLILAGTKGEFETTIVSPLENLVTMYNQLSSPTLLARKKDADHAEMLYVSDGYMTAWFMWLLKQDTYAKNAFVGKNPEIFNNILYQDQMSKLKKSKEDNKE